MVDRKEGFSEENGEALNLETSKGSPILATFCVKYLLIFHD